MNFYERKACAMDNFNLSLIEKELKKQYAGLINDEKIKSFAVEGCLSLNNIKDDNDFVFVSYSGVCRICREISNNLKSENELWAFTCTVKYKDIGDNLGFRKITDLTLVYKNN